MVWYEGFKRNKTCNKCQKNESDYMFIGRPSTEPEIVIWLCEDCYKKMPKDIFRISLEKQMRTEDMLA